MEQALCLDSTMTWVVRCLLIGGSVSAEGRRGGHLTLFTFRWSVKTTAEGRVSKHLKNLSWCGEGSQN